MILEFGRRLSFELVCPSLGLLRAFFCVQRILQIVLDVHLGFTHRLYTDCSAFLPNLRLLLVFLLRDPLRMVPISIKILSGQSVMLARLEPVEVDLRARAPAPL